MDCAICCEKIYIFATYSCTHTICHRCAVRLLFLYKNAVCPFCKISSTKPIFRAVASEKNKTKQSAGECASSTHGTEHENMPDSDKKGPDGASKRLTSDRKRLDSDASIESNASSNKRAAASLVEDEAAIYESPAVQKETKALLLHRCKECSFVAKNKEALAHHYKTAHAILICSICHQNGNQFWDELAFYTFETLPLHKKGKLAEGGFLGHVFCTHCKKYFYNLDAAKLHCNMVHQACTVCEALGQKSQYYNDYRALEEHYRSQHYCCNNSLCIKSQCYVFAYKSELWEHSLKQHGHDIKLENIRVIGGKNPPVFSLKSGTEMPTPVVYRQEVNSVSPLVNRPFFPKFTANAGSEGGSLGEQERSRQSRGSTNVPEFLNRSIVVEEDAINTSRIKQISYITKIFVKEINSAIVAYIDGAKDLPTLVQEIEESVGNETALKILENVMFLQKQKDVSAFAKEYRKKVTFPSFKEVEKVPVQPQAPVIRKFKILDLTKKDKKR